MKETEFRSIAEVIRTLRDVAPEIPRVLTPESVGVYLFIQRRFAGGGDITNDPVFQFVFRSFYRLDNAGLSDSFKRDFFVLLQEHRDGITDTQIAEIAQRLSQHKTLRNRNSLQFSFVTKLAATLDPRRPVYDSFVADLFSFSPGVSRDLDQRLQRFMQFYSHLQSAVSSARDDPEIEQLINGIAAAIPAWQEVVREKQIDFLFWSAGKLLAKSRAERLIAR